MLGASRSHGEARNPTCRRCARGDVAHTVCMPADGVPGGLLVVGGAPSGPEDAYGQPWSTETQRGFRRMVERYWTGPIRWTHGVSCAGPRDILDARTKSQQSEFDACAPYLVGEMLAGYQRVLVVGADASRAVLGARINPVLTRRAWAYVSGIPSFLVPHPVSAARNPFVKRWLEEDVRWALQAPLPQQPSGTVHVLTEPAAAFAYLTGLQPGQTVAMDIENVGDAFKDTWRFLCVGMATSGDAAHVIPAITLNDPTVREAFCRFLADPRIGKGGHFIKYDVNGLYREFGVELAGLDYDTGFQNRLLYSDCPAKLAVLAWQVGYGGYKQFTEAQMGEDDDKSEAYGKLDPDQLHAYNGRDVAVTHRLHELQTRPGRFDRHLPVWRRIVRPALMAMAQVERWGALMSESRVREYDAWLLERQTVLEARLRACPEVPPNFNPKSGPQKADLLFNVLGLSSAVKTKKGKPSTAKKALEPLKAKHPLVGILTELDSVSKQRNTYGLPMLRYVGIDGRVHTTYNFIRSGRFSSQRPNLQNLTGKGEEGKRLRACWIARPGHVLVSTDYSQIELRVLADLSGDEAMCRAFAEGGDFHTETAVLMAKLQRNKSREEFLAAYGDGTSGEQWALDLRKAAKIVNFSLVFGKGDRGLAEELRTTKAEAVKMRQLVLGAFPKMAAYQAKLIADARVNGEVSTEFGPCRRVRQLWIIGEAEDSDDAPERDPRNIAKNHPIQGTASDYTVSSMIEIVQQQQAGDLPGRLIMNIHDELVSEVPAEKVEEYAREAIRVMLSWPTRMVRLKVDCEYGPDLGNLQKLKLVVQ